MEATSHSTISVVTEKRVVEQAKAMGERVAKQRAKRGWSQEQLAAHTGHHRTYLGRLEAGKTDPTLTSILRIAAALGVDAGTLVTGLEKTIGDPTTAGRKKPEAGSAANRPRVKRSAK